MGFGHVMVEMTMADEPGAECKGQSGRVAPVIDRNRCEAKGGCVAVCPFKVFEIRSLTSSDKTELSFVGRIKAWAHGNRQAYVVRPADCHACSLCVQACPEDAIRLAAYLPAAPSTHSD
jgi:NAD-dependent dihydropyrimidine dehydrogenase PreA subunit